MEPIKIIIFFTIFLFVVLLVQGAYSFLFGSKVVEKRKLQKRLLTISAGGKHGQEKLKFYQSKALANASAFQVFFYSLPRLSALDRLLLRSGAKMTASTFFLVTVLTGFTGIICGSYLLGKQLATLAIGLIIAALPYLYLKISAHKILMKFQEQLPEALDLLGRALRSGHALTSGIEMISEEIADPLGSEFNTVADEIRLGLTLKEALENLCERVPSQDLRFFAISLMVQKETGGNIAEILDNISRLIRERVQFKRLVQTLTAEGKVSAFILLALPISMFGIIYFINYDYLSLLWTEPEGRILLGTAIVMQFIGTLVIRKIVRIEM